jgi:CheY-like chemotaxis protein
MACAHVLHVDDVLAEHLVLAEAVGDAGSPVTLHYASDGAGAWRFLARVGDLAAAPRPALVLLDLHMPLLGGMDLLRGIKNRDDWRDIPVALLTSSERAIDREQARGLGACAYLIKPFAWRDYVRLVAIIVELARPPRQVVQARRLPANRSRRVTEPMQLRIALHSLETRARRLDHNALARQVRQQRALASWRPTPPREP